MPVFHFAQNSNTDGHHKLNSLYLGEKITYDVANIQIYLACMILLETSLFYVYARTLKVKQTYVYENRPVNGCTEPRRCYIVYYIVFF